MANDLDSIDSKTFWRALGIRATGAAVVAARSANGPAGFFALSVTHLAQSPPTVLVTIGMSTSALSTIVDAGHFAVSFLSQDQRPMVDVFSGAAGLKGADRFAPGGWTELASGAPVLQDCVGALDCVLVETIERFDTVIAIGRIVSHSANAGASPLISFQGKLEILGRE